MPIKKQAILSEYTERIGKQATGWLKASLKNI
jgi:hypothetical protein